jgi:hypothetical protein
VVYRYSEHRRYPLRPERFQIFNGGDSGRHFPPGFPWISEYNTGGFSIGFHVKITPGVKVIQESDVSHRGNCSVPSIAGHQHSEKRYYRVSTPTCQITMIFNRIKMNGDEEMSIDMMRGRGYVE